MALVTTADFPGLVPDISALGRGAIQGAQLAQAAQQMRANEQQMAAQEQQREFESIVRGAVQLKSIPTREERIKFLESRSQEILDRGGNPSDTQEVLNLLKQGNDEQANQLIERTLDVGRQFGIIQPQQTRFEPILNAEGEVIAQKDVTTGRAFADPRAAERLKQSVDAGKKVQSSEILPGGLTRITYTDGTTEVVQEDDATKALIKQSELWGAELQGLRAGERSAASESIKQSIEAFKGLKSVKTSISNLEEGMKLIDEGAETGVVASRLPSVKAASIKLDTLQGQLGLDVIGNTTFGALSEAELRFALDTALPKKLQPEELKKWMKEKRDAQIKLSNYLEDAAIFLGTPGNNVADFLEMKRQEQKDEQSQETTTVSQQSLQSELTADEQRELEELRRRFRSGNP